MLSGVLRAVQTIPAAVEGLVSRSSSVRGAPPTSGQRDSVEYASVRSSVERLPPPPAAEAYSQEAPLFDAYALERLQRMHEGAPLLYQTTGPAIPSPPQPLSETSSDVRAEVRRQLAEMMALRDEESRRLRAQVEALSLENQSLRLRSEMGVQGGVAHPKVGLNGVNGLPGFGWLGRGLGSLIGQARNSRTLDLGHQAQPPPPPLPNPRALEFQAAPATVVRPEAQPDLTQGSQQVGFPSNVGPCGLGPSPGAHLPAAQEPRPAATASGFPQVQHVDPGFQVGVGDGFVSQDFSTRLQPRPPQDPEQHQEQAGSNGPLGPSGQAGADTGLDAMSVVLTGMAQLQSVVTELASPKAQDRPEVIKPGVVTLPELPGHSPESSLAFADWLHASRPALADISDSSEELWSLIVSEATAWYSAYLRMDPLSRLSAKPEASSQLSQPKWTRVSRRIETMIIAAAPQDVRDEISASRTSGLFPLVCKLYVVYGPGTLMERELGLKHISDPPAGTTIQDTVDILRRWKR